MKKLIIAVAIIGVAVVSSVGTVAATGYEMPWTKNIYQVSGREDWASSVSVFDDGGNKCYLVNNSQNGNVSISCVRMR